MVRSMRRGRGAALILVLWLVASLSLVVMASARSVRQQSQRAATDLERMRVENMLDAAIELTAQRLLTDRNVANVYSLQRLPLDGKDVWVENIQINNTSTLTLTKLI